MQCDDQPTLVLDLLDDAAPTSMLTMGHYTLLFGLSLATAMPPAAWLIPPGLTLPTIRPDPFPVLSADDLAAILGRPTAEVGRGQIPLGEIDRRLRDLVVSIDVFQAAGRRGTLVSLGVVRPDGPGTRPADTAISDLWALARAAMARFGVLVAYQLDGAPDARLVLYGGITAQIAWRAGPRVVTASVTSLDGDDAWTIHAVRSIAARLVGRLC